MLAFLFGSKDAKIRTMKTASAIALMNGAVDVFIFCVL